MMEMLEMLLWIIATPMLLFVGLAWLGFIWGYRTHTMGSDLQGQRQISYETFYQIRKC